MTTVDESKSVNPATQGEKRLSDDIEVLEAEAKEMTLQQEKVIKTIRELMEAEDPKNGIYHHREIFDMQQEKLRLGVDIKFRTNKVNRIKLGIDEAQMSEGVQNGFLF